MDHSVIWTDLGNIANALKNGSARAWASEPNTLLAFYRSTDAMALALAMMIGIIVVHIVIGELTRNYSQVDKAWSILPPLYTWHFALHDFVNRNTWNPRLLIAAVLISIWGVRLTYNFARKGGYAWDGQDYRYIYVRGKVGDAVMTILNFTAICPAQNALLMGMVAPLYVVSLHPDVDLNLLDGAAASLFLIMLWIEVIADDQQFVFQTQKHTLLHYLDRSQLTGDYQSGFLQQGIWRYSRHPNFFAEMCLWWAVHLFSVAVVGLNGTVAGTACLTGLFQVTTWLTEHISSEKYPTYKDYQASVNRFLPWFPSKRANAEHLKAH